LAPGTAHHVLNIFRDWDVPEETDKFHQENSSYANKTIDNYCREQIKLFHSNIKLLIPEENTIYFKVPWKPGGINSLHEEHEAYLNEFKNRVLNKLKGLIKKSLDDEPELKSKKKIVEVRNLSPFERLCATLVITERKLSSIINIFYIIMHDDFLIYFPHLRLEPDFFLSYFQHLTWGKIQNNQCRRQLLPHYRLIARSNH
jgi:hypothetical protein